ncbi:sialidase family protein [Streptomyces sp. NBC_00370]|uniref:sialidase family protein n=1 Tax=Streptomyces sp. NBC_00370 TaxID=2975728 RepID=UPI002E27480B
MVTAPTLPGENQIAVSQDDDGNGDVRDLVMVARANGNAAKATSSDGGRTWGPFKEDPALPSHNIAEDFFTVLNDPAQPDGADWDTYPMADEYAPGKFYVVWEADTMHIMVGKLDVSGTAK